MLFDMQNDPHELNDLGGSPKQEHAEIRAELSSKLFHWLRNLKHRTTVSHQELSWRYGVDFEDKVGILIGYWEDENGKNF